MTLTPRTSIAAGIPLSIGYEGKTIEISSPSTSRRTRMLVEPGNSEI